MKIIAGTFQNHSLEMPKGVQTRPTSSLLRETLFNILQTIVIDTNFLDLFAGSGAVGLEALSRGAQKSVFIEKHPYAIKALTKNIDKLNVQTQSLLMKKDVFLGLKLLAKKKFLFDIIFADPPYRTKNESVLLSQIFNTLEQYSLIKHLGYFFLETHSQVKESFQISQVWHLLNKRKIGDSLLWQYQYQKKEEKIL